MKKVLIGAGIFAVLVVIVIASLRGKEPSGKEVRTETVEVEDIALRVKASGEIDPRVQVKISAPVIGRIEKLHVEEGDVIEAGEPFLELEREAFLAARDQWRAQLRSAQTAVRRSEIELEDARLKERRFDRLGTEGIVSAEQREASALSAASAALALDQARDAVRQAQANLTKAQDDLTKTTIFAPLSGRVIELNAEEGEVVVSGTMNNPASVIGTIADLSEILAVVEVDETEIVDVALGQDVTIEVDAVPDHEYHGRVVEIGSSGFTPHRGQDVIYFRVKILLEDADERLRPGMSARADVVAKVHSDVPIVPIEAVVERDDPERDGEGRKVVYSFDEGAAVEVPVSTGIANTTQVEITAGLSGGESVIVGPYRTLKDLEDGDVVRLARNDGEDDAEKAAPEDSPAEEETDDS
ncbi:MAG: efflux RND transporter periplasmic adaptor subunit [Acidobacteriota bacterium]